MVCYKRRRNIRSERRKEKQGEEETKKKKELPSGSSKHKAEEKVSTKKKERERRIVPTICSQELVNLEIAVNLTILFGFLRVEFQIGKRSQIMLQVKLFLRDQEH